MTYYINKTVEGFTFYTIFPIIRFPNYASISEMHMELNSNVILVQSNLGCRTLGLLYLTVLPALYATLSASIFVVPINPGSKTIITEHSTVSQIANIR